MHYTFVRLQVCACEFVAFPRDYYEATAKPQVVVQNGFESQASIEAGRVTVDGKAVKSGHVLRDGQRIVRISGGKLW